MSYKLWVRMEPQNCPALAASHQYGMHALFDSEPSKIRNITQCDYSILFGKSVRQFVLVFKVVGVSCNEHNHIPFQVNYFL